jgi:CelD/BcsL family acetyltransferase involved in cellulose biosynthesis
MNLECIANSKDMDARLMHEWNSLSAKAGTTPFSSFTFIKTWAEQYEDLAPLRLYIASTSDGIIGLAPLQDENGILKFVGGLDYQSGADYCDFILHPALHEEAMAIFTTIFNNNPFQLNELPNDSLGKTYLETHGIGKVVEGTVVSSMQLPLTWEEYLSNLDPTVRKDLLYYLRRAEKDLAPRFSAADPNNADDVLKKMNLLFQLHQEEWQSRGEIGCFSADSRGARFREFHSALALGFAKENHLHLAYLENDSSPISVQYNFTDDKTFYHYLGGTNIRLMKFSPGKILLGRILQDIIYRGLHTYDFLRGNEGYKFKYGAKSASNFNIHS